MSRNKRPRKAYRPKRVTHDTVAVAVHHAAKCSSDERQEIMAMFITAVTALRQGVATELQWSIAAGQLAVAMAIERQGKVRGLLGHLQHIEAQLQAVYDRATCTGRWMRTALYYQELDALDLLVSLYKFQLAQLGRGEFMAAVRAAQQQNIADGHTVVLERNIERMAA